MNHHTFVWFLSQEMSIPISRHTVEETRPAMYIICNAYGLILEYRFGA